MSALVINGVPVECINRAAIMYYVPATVIISVLSIEGGRVGSANRNHNGTIDYGPMQINSLWLSKLEKYGYTKTQLQYDPCVNVAVGTWILARAIADGRSPWEGIGNYHSHIYNQNMQYRYKVKNFYKTLINYLHGQESEAKSKVLYKDIRHRLSIS